MQFIFLIALLRARDEAYDLVILVDKEDRETEDEFCVLVVFDVNPSTVSDLGTLLTSKHLNPSVPTPPSLNL